METMETRGEPSDNWYWYKFAAVHVVSACEHALQWTLYKITKKTFEWCVAFLSLLESLYINHYIRILTTATLVTDIFQWKCWKYKKRNAFDCCGCRFRMYSTQPATKPGVERGRCAEWWSMAWWHVHAPPPSRSLSLLIGADQGKLGTF
jgi:hypothetical protein